MYIFRIFRSSLYIKVAVTKAKNAESHPAPFCDIHGAVCAMYITEGGMRTRSLGCIAANAVTASPSQSWVTFESLDLESSFLVCRYIFRIFRSSLYIKVIRYDGHAGVLKSQIADPQPSSWECGLQFPIRRQPCNDTDRASIMYDVSSRSRGG